MASFPAMQIPVLTKAVVSEKIPAAERRTASRKWKRSTAKANGRADELEASRLADELAANEPHALRSAVVTSRSAGSR